MAKGEKGGGKKGGGRTFDVSSLIGMILVVGLVLFGIVSGDEGVDFGALQYFWDPNSLYIVVGGTAGALFLMFPLDQFARVPKSLGMIMRPKKYVAEDYIPEIVEYAKLARVNGILALEDKLGDIKDPYFRQGIQMMVDAVEPDAVRDRMEAFIDQVDSRHAAEVSFYDKGGAMAPGFGMIGTLIGLVNMMQNMEDPSAIGPGMAVALITTFYGSLISNGFFIPVSTKLRIRHGEESLCMIVVYEGVNAIQNGENPSFIQDKLLNLLPEYKKNKKSKKGKKGGDAAAEG